jgi:3-hydroxybutyryl-CoA dehydrogenase
MKLEDINVVAVIGAGSMGAQIAQQLTQIGKYRVNITDVEEKAVNAGIEGIRTRLQKFFVDKGKMSQGDMDETMARIKGTTTIAEAVKDADLIIESVFEKMSIKQQVFKAADEAAPEHAIIASNSSMMDITQIGQETQRRDKTVGMHFFNPVAVMKLVEVSRGPLTSQETVDVIVELAKKLGKTPVICTDNSYGFLANRAYSAFKREAVQIVWERVASPEDVDTALKLGYNLPWGPLELDDRLGGWAHMYASRDDRVREQGEIGRLHPLIKMMVRAGYTGGPGKKGIYAFWDEVLKRK